MSRASVKRDLEYMRNRFNAPIEYDRELNGYRFGRPRSGPRYELPGLWFKAAEGHALPPHLHLPTRPPPRPPPPPPPAPPPPPPPPALWEGQVSPLVERLKGILGSGDHSWKEI